MIVYCWIHLLTAANSDRIISALVKSGTAVSMPSSMLQSDDWPVAILCLEVNTKQKDNAEAYAAIKSVVDGLGVKYYSIMVSPPGVANWSGPNLTFSEMKKQAQTRIVKAPHIKLVPKQEPTPEPTV